MKRRIVVAFLVCFALWPAVHRGLVAVYGVNPWKLAGWAMYTRPHFQSELALWRRSDAGEEQPISRLTDWERVLLEEFLQRRYTLGDLASPEPLVRELQQRLGADVVVELRTRYFELATASIQERVVRRVYERPGAAGRG